MEPSCVHDYLLLDWAGTHLSNQAQARLRLDANGRLVALWLMHRSRVRTLETDTTLCFAQNVITRRCTGADLGRSFAPLKLPIARPGDLDRYRVRAFGCW